MIITIVYIFLLFMTTNRYFVLLRAVNSVDNVKRTWVNYGVSHDWTDTEQGQVSDHSNTVCVKNSRNVDFVDEIELINELNILVQRKLERQYYDIARHVFLRPVFA